MHDDISMEEKKRIIREEAQQPKGFTYHSHTVADAATPRGRYAAVEAATVVGAGAPQYPRQPVDSAFANDPVPDEPPLGYAIDEQEPVGETFEIERSLGAVAAPSSGLVPPSPDEVDAQQRLPSQPPSFKRRI